MATQHSVMTAKTRIADKSFHVEDDNSDLKIVVNQDKTIDQID